MADEKVASVPFELLNDNALVTAVRNTYRSFSQRRNALGLSNPGTFENIAREVQKDVFLTNFMFTGMRADWTKPISNSPIFHISHALSMGAQGLPPYAFAALYGTPKVFLQGQIDNDGSLSARSNYRWNESLVTRTNAQIQSGQGVLTVENDFAGKDFTASFKAMNPSIIEGGVSGIFIASYLQSVSPTLSLGLEAVWQRAAMNSSPEAMLSYGARYKGPDWVAALKIEAEGPQGAGINTSYWKKLTDKVSAGADLNLQFAPGLGGRGGLMGGGAQKEGTATAGAKYEFTASTFRTQLDSKGRLSCLLEKNILPAVRVTFAGEMDHLKQQAKVGMGVSIEAMSEDLMEQAQKGSLQTPSPPF